MEFWLEIFSIFSFCCFDHLNMYYQQVGPGGRVGINYLLHLPPGLLRDCTKASTGLFYADKATGLRIRCLKHPLLQPQEADLPEIKQAERLTSVYGMGCVSWKGGCFITNKKMFTHVFDP